ncbi:MAG TPA: hypothetical protein VFY10_11600 [Dehalococcoidia bacterium]|nr:hypothetical protein [Dehalococcoidia bacterium]
MTITAPATRTRAEIKADRQERRAQILERWDRRQLARDFAAMDSTLWPSIPEKWVESLLVDRGVDLGRFFRILDRASMEKGAPVTKAMWIDIAARLARLIHLKEMPYDEYLQTDEWKLRAAQCKERYGYTCALDDRHPAEHAHHRTYVRRGRERDTDLIPLCASCHEKHHGKGTRWPG